MQYDHAPPWLSGRRRPTTPFVPATQTSPTGPIQIPGKLSTPAALSVTGVQPAMVAGSGGAVAPVLALPVVAEPPAGGGGLLVVVAPAPPVPVAGGSFPTDAAGSPLPSAPGAPAPL
jgi:hypothetical protein